MVVGKDTIGCSCWGSINPLGLWDPEGFPQLGVEV